MSDLPQRAALFALYQLTIIAGIVLMPIALLARRGGITLPVGRLVAGLGRAYEDVRASGS